MPEYDKTNRGVLFKNNKTKDTQPDYRGNINVDGVDKDISAWIKDYTDSETGQQKKLLSISVQEPYKKKPKDYAEESKGAIPADDFDDQIPF